MQEFGRDERGGRGQIYQMYIPMYLEIMSQQNVFVVRTGQHLAPASGARARSQTN